MCSRFYICIVDTRIQIKNLIKEIKYVSTQTFLDHKKKEKLSIKFKNIFPSLYLHCIHFKPMLTILCYNFKCYMTVDFISNEKFYEFLR